MKGIFPIDKFRTLQTPFYYYDTKVLRDTLSAINHEVAKYPNYSVHYAVKANANPKVLAIIRAMDGTLSQLPEKFRYRGSGACGLGGRQCQDE